VDTFIQLSILINLSLQLLEVEIKYRHISQQQELVGAKRINLIKGLTQLYAVVGGDLGLREVT